MYDDVRLSLPDTLDREVIFKRLEKVLDPELDESILKLGFVKSIKAESGQLWRSQGQHAHHQTEQNGPTR